MEKISSEESVNSQGLEETPKKKKRITKRSTGKKGNAVRWSDDLILRLIDEYEARPFLWPGTSCSRDFARATIVTYHELLWPFDHVKDSL